MVMTRTPVITSWLDLLPVPLNCLLSTGFFYLCLGVPIP